MTLTKTDTPVAAYLVRDDEGYRPTGEYVYFSEEASTPLPPKIRKLIEKHYGMLPPGGDEMACDYPYEKFGPIFSRKERITMFIAGCQNCGKSYYISQFIRLYKTLRPERETPSTM